MTTLMPSRPDVIDEAFGDEVVLVNLRTGRYYSLEGSAGRLWSALAAEGATPEIVAAVLDAPVTAVLPFLHRLVEEELVVVHGEPLAPDPGEETLPEEQRARLLVFSDMEDILLLDPIHDIDLDGSGWPARPASEAA